MTVMDSRRYVASVGEEDDFFTSALQLRLAASIVSRLVERNGGSDAGDVFFNDDSNGEELDREEYVDPEMWDPDEETLPEMDIILENISECL
jgi:hypothetical protein